MSALCFLQLGRCTGDPATRSTTIVVALHNHWAAHCYGDCETHAAVDVAVVAEASLAIMPPV